MTVEKFTPQIVTGKQQGKNWHALATDEILERLNTFAEQGLSTAEVEQRLQTYGPNQLREAPPTSI